MYHRIAEPAVDPWGLCVSRRNFAQQLAVLGANATVVKTSELLDRLKGARSGRPLVALTFDDGYADNLHLALPLLREAAMPATVFVATGWTGHGQAFWWDELAGIVLGPGKRPARLEISVGSARIEWPQSARSGRVVAPAEERDELHRFLWQVLRQLTDAERASAIEQLRRWSGQAAKLDSMARPMTAGEVLAAHRSGMVEIGAHGRTHRSLTAVPLAERETEIRGSREECRQITGESPACFAYPHGDVDDATAAIAAAAGFRHGFGSRHGLMWARGDAYRVPRIVVPDVDGTAFERKLCAEWLA